MKTFVRVLATASMLMAAGAVAHAECINKAGKGTGGNDEFGEVPGLGSRSPGNRLGDVGFVDGIEPKGRRGSRL